MHPFTVLTAVAAPLEIAKIDTGMILPGRYMRRHRPPGHGYGEAFLSELGFGDLARGRGIRRDGLWPASSRGPELWRDIPGELHSERDSGDHPCRGGHPRPL